MPTFVKRGRTGPLKQGPVVGTHQVQINFSSSGDNILVTAIANRIIRVHKLILVGASASNIRFWSGASADNEPITGQMNFNGNFTIALDSDDFTIETNPGDSLVLASSNAVQIGGLLVYSVE